MTKREMAFLVMATTFILGFVLIHYWGILASLPVFAVGSFLHDKLTKEQKEQEVEQLRAENEALKMELERIKLGKNNDDK